MFATKCSCKNCFVYILVSIILGIGLTILLFFTPLSSIVGTLIMTIFSGTALISLGVLTAIACSSDCSAMKRALKQDGICAAIAAVVAFIFGITNSIVQYSGLTIILLFIIITAFLVLLMSFTSIIVTTIKYLHLKDC